MGVDVVGRGEELDALEGFLGRKAADGPVALVLEGEAGIGKSTLWRSGVEAAKERGLHVLACWPAEVELGVAYAGLGDLLEDVLADVLPELPAPRRRALEAAVLLRDDSDAPVDFRAVSVAVRSALQILSAREPVLVAIDDVQWLDPSSANVLAFALRRLEREDVRVLLARRLGEARPVSELERVLDEQRTSRLAVGPLTPGAVHAILQRRLGRGFARPTLLRLHEASGGNPFFALELARSLGADGGSGDPTRLLPLPDVLGEVVEARLAELPQPALAALLIIAAAGRGTHAFLRAAGLDDSTLEPGRAAGVIDAVDDGVVFAHPLLASAIYHGSPEHERRAAHRLVAGVLEDLVVRARHVALAAEGPDADTAAALEEAAATAQLRGAPIAAAELGEHALRVTPEHAEEDRRRRALSTARAHVMAGEEERCRTIALELLSTVPTGPSRAEVLALLADVEGLDRAAGLLEQAIVEASCRPALQARLHQRLAGIGRLTRGLAWGEGHALEALRLAEELDDDALRAGALSVLALIRFGRGDADAPTLAERAHALAATCGDPEQLQEASMAHAHTLVWAADTERARALLEERYELEAQRNERASTEALWFLSFVELQAGRWKVAAEHAERSLDINTQYGAAFPQLFFPVALIAAHRGDLARAATLAAHARGLAEGEGALLPGIVSVAGIVEAWSGAPVAAVASFALAEEQADAAELWEPGMREWRPDYAEALLELGRVDEAIRLLDDWEEAAQHVGRGWVLAQVRRCRGLVAAAQGDVETALANLEAAVTEHAEAGDPFGRARALLALGVTRRRARQKRRAREALEAALAGFETLGAAGWAEKARGELGRIGGRTQVEGLTPAEQRVAALVAEGRTNREVASALFLAERTVASHLSHIYAKLGIRSRTELARKLPTF